jgi:hypothetical protein
MNELKVSEQSDLLSPERLDQAMRVADLLASSTFVPKDFIGKPGNILVAMQWGAEIGLKPLQAMQNIAVINGRPSIWGDAMLALVQSSPAYEWHEETEEDARGTCTVKRKGHEPYTVVFTVEDAKKAQLWGKQGPWTQYPKRMLKLRARGYALRDKFADALKGMNSTEELIDTQESYQHVEKDITPPKEEAPKIEARPAITTYPDDKFEANFPKWKSYIEAGTKSFDQIIATVSSKHKLTDEQLNAIKALTKIDKVDERPMVTYAQVADMLHKATTIDALDEAADLVGSIKDEQQRAELMEIYKSHEAKINFK